MRINVSLKRGDTPLCNFQCCCCRCCCCSGHQLRNNPTNSYCWIADEQIKCSVCVAFNKCHLTFARLASIHIHISISIYIAISIDHFQCTQCQMMKSNQITISTKAGSIYAYNYYKQKNCWTHTYHNKLMVSFITSVYCTRSLSTPLLPPHVRNSFPHIAFFSPFIHSFQLTIHSLFLSSIFISSWNWNERSA